MTRGAASTFAAGSRSRRTAALAVCVGLLGPLPAGQGAALEGGAPASEPGELDVPRGIAREGAFTREGAFARAAPPTASLDELLSSARRLAREHHPTPTPPPEDPFGPVRSAGELWRLRSQLAFASAALARGDGPTARAAVDALSPEPLGLPGVVDWIRLAAEPRGPKRPALGLDLVGAALGVHSRTSVEPIARRALLWAAREARTESERAAVREAFGRHEARLPSTPRARISRALVLSRTASEREVPGALDALATLANEVPDAPERAPDLFEDEDRERFLDAVLMATPEARIARARAIVGRPGADTNPLLRGLPEDPLTRLAVAEVRLAAGQLRDALRELRALVLRPGGPGDGSSTSASPDTLLDLRRVESLTLSAELRLELLSYSGGTPPSAKRRAKRRARRVSSAFLPAAPTPAQAALADALLGRADILLADPALRDPDRRRLLADVLRLAVKSQRWEELGRRLEALVAADPAATTAGEEMFQRAFALYRAGDPASLAQAVRRLEEQATLFRDPALRRRATYWLARARGRLGETEPSRTLLASLLTGTSSDLYGRFAAEILGVPVPNPTSSAREAGAGLPADRPGPVSRELLACGLPDLAEDAAEADGSLDLLFAADLAAERGEYRRAAVLLRSRYPELGTPEEGSVPVAARQAYYPLARWSLLTQVALEKELPPSLLYGLIRQESIFQESARSHAGALGLMQVMPATGRLLLRREGRRDHVDLRDPRENVRLGAAYLDQMIELFGGDTMLALAAYNAGPGRVIRWRRERPGMPKDEFLETMPLAEPRDYVKKVLFFEGAYVALYGETLRGAVRPEPVVAVAPSR